jgi:hypothetical protein
MPLAEGSNCAALAETFVTDSAGAGVCHPQGVANSATERPACFFEESSTPPIHELGSWPAAFLEGVSKLRYMFRTDGIWTRVSGL